jgi:hypothetical protein
MTEESLYEAKTFDEFWKVYVSMHDRPATRALHAVATASMLGCVFMGIRTRRIGWFVAAPIVDYAIAQTSHRLFQGNRTEPYRNPPWHLRAELQLFWLTITGRMDAEIERLRAS